MVLLLQTGPNIQMVGARMKESLDGSSQKIFFVLRMQVSSETQCDSEPMVVAPVYIQYWAFLL